MEDKILVSFPNLGIDLNISRVAFKPFGIPIYWYGIIISLAFLLCILWAMKDSRKFDLVPETIIDLMLFAAPAAIICARIYYVIFSWDEYKNNLSEIVNLRHGGLAYFGGIIGAIIAAYFVARYKKLNIIKFFDFAIPYVALGQAIGRWGNFFNQEAFGTNTTLPWGMTSATTRAYLYNNADQLQQLHGITVYPDLPVHPTFLYESILDLVVFALLLWFRKKKKFDGEVFALYFVTYSLGRALIEGLRTDSLWIGNFRASQLLAVVFVIAFGAFIIYKRNKVKNESLAADEVEPSGYADVLRIMEEENQKNDQFVEEEQTEAHEDSEDSTEDTEESESNSDEAEVQESEGYEDSSDDTGSDDSGSDGQK
jgi:phosphatidylglycerol:prolipoprotein diacylglycerol transferase